ncbi:hypothetical protein OIU74_007757 [Salix koriyanagi]|uniref:Uncharacterized protein n=1 Tax=Salix koriyanagi TaxID=2511006 RepID=A0A9Q0U4E5_9ROSI|nr:hypothetical protein OIU74_007757 [Salix koriyanagi]
MRNRNRASKNSVAQEKDSSSYYERGTSCSFAQINSQGNRINKNFGRKLASREILVQATICNWGQ